MTLVATVLTALKLIVMLSVSMPADSLLLLVLVNTVGGTYEQAAGCRPIAMQVECAMAFWLVASNSELSGQPSRPTSELKFAAGLV